MVNRILITGVGGFVGRALLEDLRKDSDNIIVTIRRDTNKIDKLTEDHTMVGDITDFELVRRAVADYEPNTIYHLASQAIVRTCANDPITAYNINVMGTVNLLEAVRQCQVAGATFCKSIVVSTSDKAYGHAPVPYTEDTPLMPKYTYETTKACQDLVCQNYFHNYAVPVKIARCSNIYGPGDPNWSRLIPNTIRRVLQNLAPELYSDVAEYIREFVYVDDAVSALKLINSVGVSGEAFCVGGTDAVRIKDLVDLICTLCGVSSEVKIIEKAAAFKEIQHQFIDGKKMKSMGWVPSVTLQEGLKRTIEFYKGSL